ncbi:universal stress protein [Pontibacter sp. G13]|uniref:universal stress protein n=1 Tax=Pontibacter sp. G13 TaxID=3074898 RepID=UPI0028891446|nr:universal stress protein [Pontibacter sp. G13]WNJ20793.1 universal stress protein [Pontibacter sp. G13]
MDPQNHSALATAVKTILFPTDFSPSAHHAMKHAVRIAETWDAKLIMVHAYHYSAVGSFYVTPELIHMVNNNRRDEAESAIQNYIETIKEETGGKIDIAYQLVYGFPEDEILTIAKDQDADLIVMGTKGAGNLAEKWIGSITSRIIERSEVPVLAIPSETDVQSVKRIAYATNFEEKDLRLPEFLLAVTEKYEATLTCIHINKEEQDEWNQLQLAMRKQMFGLENRAPKVEFHILHNDNLQTGLEEYVEENEIDVLAVLSKQHGFWDRLFMRSDTRTLALSSKIPLLVLKRDK